MKKLFLSPLFLVGLAVRVALIAALQPVPVTEWYAPFMDVSTSQFTLDPWGTWQDANGDSVAFPYGYVMWLIFLPLTLLAKLTQLPVAVGYGTTLLIADIALFVVLRKIWSGHDRLLTYAYWLSPIVIVASYALGFNDLIPVLLLTVSLLMVRDGRFGWAGFALVAAVSAKFSMVIALPFFAIYLLHNRVVRHLFVQFAKGLAVGAVVFVAPFLFSQAGVDTLINNPELDKVYSLALPLNDDVSVYVVPLALALMLYATWRVKRLNFELFYFTLGSAFLLLVLLTPASPGWFIWSIPLLVAYQLSGDRFAITFSAVFSLLYISATVLYGAKDVRAINGLDYAWMRSLAGSVNGEVVSIVQTLIIATGAVLAVRIWRASISRNDFFRLSRKPFVIGIAGDSGAGKDTYAAAVGGLFGRHSVTSISGDDYHLWDRRRPMWQVITHLNPMANDLERFANDVVSLTDGKAIDAAHYDHDTGQMTRPRKIASNDIILASGLHALYLPIMRDCYGLSVYLDIDENVRRYFKIERDVHKRGHSEERVLESLEKRSKDAARFIRPQIQHADLVLSIQPIHPLMLGESQIKGPLRFKLVARSRHGLNELALTRVLIGVCGLHVDVVTSEDASEVEITIEGETTAPDVALAAQMVCPRVLEFLDTEPQWEDGVTGLMQLITLSHINQALTKRFI